MFSNLRPKTLTILLVATFIVSAMIFNSLTPPSSNVGQRLTRTASRPSSSLESAVAEQAPILNHVVAPRLGNETVKAELGHAAWRLFHTTLARFPEKPKPDESSALRSYLQLFARLYPCGECAEHFVKILDKFPPQVSSRNAAIGWGCHVHNEVNKSLGKALFDCSKIDEEYDCGCGKDTAEESGEKSGYNRAREGYETKRGVEIALTAVSESSSRDHEVEGETQPVKLMREEYA